MKACEIKEHRAVSQGYSRSKDDAVTLQQAIDERTRGLLSQSDLRFGTKLTNLALKELGHRASHLRSK